MTEHEYEKLRKLLPLRSRVALDIMVDTGLRVSDVLRIPKADLAKTIHIIEAKNGFEHDVNLSTRTLRGARRLSKNVEGCRIVPTSRKTIWQDMQKACKRLNIENISPHSCRKLYARRVYAQTGSLEKTRQIMGHHSQASTIFYVFDVK